MELRPAARRGPGTPGRHGFLRPRAWVVRREGQLDHSAPGGPGIVPGRRAGGIAWSDAPAAWPRAVRYLLSNVQRAVDDAGPDGVCPAFAQCRTAVDRSGTRQPDGVSVPVSHSSDPDADADAYGPEPEPEPDADGAEPDADADGAEPDADADADGAEPDADAYGVDASTCPDDGGARACPDGA
ncbi:hypothetical protein ACX5I6_07955 [Arthrobacter sp. MMS24-T111]